MNPPVLRLLLFVLLVLGTGAPSALASREWEGAWRIADGDAERVMLIVDGYWTIAAFDRKAPRFLRTMGGPFRADGKAVSSVLQFDSEDRSQVGTRVSVSVERFGDELQVRQDDGSLEVWRRIEETTGALTGVWRITGRVRDGQTEAMPLRARRTLKILTGSRFQWIAINVETGEFSGTGGGTYVYENGNYTERLEFFSRDATRVGASLSFQGEIKDGVWHHRGLSSRGDPIHELWSKMPPADHGFSAP